MPSETFRLQTAWAWKDKAGTKKQFCVAAPCCTIRMVCGSAALFSKHDAGIPCLLLFFPDNGFEWRNESLQKPPKGWYYVRESGADGILKATYQNIATVWQGDFHNAKQVLSAMKKKVRKPAAVRSDADIAALSTPTV